jgi:hypothetical protein
VIHVCIPNCERKIVLKRCLEALREHTRSDTCVYLFDNNSRLTPERYEWLCYLQASGLVDRLTVDNFISVEKPIPKLEIHFRFVSEMVYRNHPEDLYLFLDSDILLAEDWERAFAAALEYKKPETIFIMKQRVERYGIKGTSWDTYEFTYDSDLNNSALYFMDHTMLTTYEEVLREIGQNHRGHWDDIDVSKHLQDTDAGLFNMRIEPKGSAVIAVHASDQFSLMTAAKTSTTSSVTEDRRAQIRADEEAIKDLSLDELFERYKNTKGF